MSKDISNFKPVEGWFFVEIIKPTTEELSKYYKDTGEVRSSSKSAGSPVEFKKAVIKNTFDEEKYPVGSEWMMGESPGVKINYFGKPILAIQEKDLYARVQ